MENNTSTDVDKLITFGKMAFEQGWYDQAREYFEQALALDADNREAMKGLARVYEILSRKAAMAVEPTRAKPVESPRPEPIAAPEARVPSGGLRGLTLGRKVSVSGALLALFCFFLPWMELSCSGMRVTTVSGMDMAANSSQADSAGWMLFLVPLAALSVLVTVYLALGIPTLRAHISATFESIEALVGLVVTSRVYFVIQDAMQDAIQNARNSSDLALPIPTPEFFLRFVYGYWGTLAGFVAVIVGALWDWKESQSKPRDKTMHVLAGRYRTRYVLAGIVLLAVVLTVAWTMIVGTTPKGLENWLPLAATPTPDYAREYETKAAQREATRAAGATPTKRPTPIPPTPKPVPGRVGQKVEAGGIALTVNNVSTARSIEEFWEADAGFHFLVVDVTLQTTTRDSAPYNIWYFSLKDSQDFEYTITMVAPKPQLQWGNLSQGEKVRGNVAFEIPENSRGLVLSYEPWELLDRYEPLKVDLGR
jgi:hypothetical protein